MVLLYRDVGGINFRGGYLPLLLRQPVTVGLRWVTRGNFLTAAAIDKHPGVDWAGQHLLDHLVIGSSPDHLAIVITPLDMAGHLKLVFQKVALDCSSSLKE